MSNAQEQPVAPDAPIDGEDDSSAARAETPADTASTAPTANDDAPAADPVVSGADHGFPTRPDDDPHSPVTRAVRGAAAWSWRFMIIVGAVALAVVGLIQIKTVVVPVLVAVLVASLLAPVVDWLHRRRVPRALASLLALLGAIGLVGGLLTLAGASIATGFRDLADTAWEGIQELIRWLSTGPLQLSQTDLDAYVAQIQDSLESNAEQILSGALSVGTSVGHVLAGALIALFCLFFFLKEGRVIWTWLVGLFPAATRHHVDGAGRRGWASLGTYARTQLLVALIDGVGIGLGAWILGVPLALPLGVLVFVGSFIPIVGAVVTGAVAVVVALVDQGPLIALVMLGVVLLVQQAESNLLQPKLMGWALNLHPVAVLLAVAAGTIIGGVVGALFAVPLIAVANTVLNYLTGKPDPLGPDDPRLHRRRRRKTKISAPATDS
ncbi:AI-2E family transporter [Ruania alba]|uniref:Predicted PurR-regulated permease PerM n=1 Tax=Ruania alba TaxID=648782 RepID=A0A1H5N4H6_9MICO|nr:AI-2E family transporter [Ruania alba]SEE96502.1 Predicted PurR-regulated permease PerM [Ruania alba]